MTLKSDHLKFKKEIQNRGIEYLIHFTPTINLYSIYEEQRILSRAYLEKLDISQTDILDFVEFTDSIRYDDKNFINLSISFPNHFLFTKFRERTAEMPHINWCVLKINPKYIYKDTTLFSVTNAASTIAKSQYKITGDFEKFLILFSEKVNLKYGIANRNGLQRKFTTDAQAEVLVKDEIPASDILEVCFKDKRDLAAGKAALSQFDTTKFNIDPILFTNRRT